MTKETAIKINLQASSESKTAEDQYETTKGMITGNRAVPGNGTGPC